MKQKESELHITSEGNPQKVSHPLTCNKLLSENCTGLNCECEPGHFILKKKKHVPKTLA